MDLSGASNTAIFLNPLKIPQLIQENDLLLSAAATNLDLDRVHSCITFFVLHFSHVYLCMLVI